MHPDVAPLLLVRECMPDQFASLGTAACVVDEGLAWLSGVTPGETLSVNWDGKIQCQVNVPETAISDQQLLLPCTPQK
ncbi:hypothetical protein E1E07_25320 [Escherichia coli]|nr:hypothetical protein [Escherichia coli]EFH2827400.1 hypothetical protein [Escherichia coli]EFH5184087.1 hypothetical protein [Escherichia coli]